MESSDDEGESIPHIVSSYYLVDDKEEPISFSELPIQDYEGDNPEEKRKQIFLHGTTDNGLQKVYKQVTAWKFDLSETKLQLLVLSKENNWIKLQKPRKSFEDIIRTILITVHYLHFVKKSPEMDEKSLWDHLSKVFSTYEVRPSETDLVDHRSLISETVKRDEDLAKSKVLAVLLQEEPGKRRAPDEDIGSTSRPAFIVEDDMIDEPEEDESDEDDDLFDSVCSICDNGGDLLCCEGKCMRSFHATVDAGSESMCESLGLSDEQVEAIQNFLCKNCQHKQHQCFACGELGSSDSDSSGTEVFRCVSGTCGRYYHPHCVAKLLHRESEANAEDLQHKIAAGGSFTCPVHKCYVCKQGEVKEDPELQFAICRRCPKSYHKKCLPRRIAFDDIEDEGIIQRAWRDLIPNRILIYCLKHTIDEEIGTPIRNHIKFPKVGEKKKKQASDRLVNKEKVESRERSMASEGALGRRPSSKSLDGVGKLASAIKEGDSSKKNERRSSALDSLKNQKVIDTSRKHLKKVGSTKASKTTGGEGGASLGDRLYALMNKGSDHVKSSKEDTPDNEHEQSLTVKKPVTKGASVLPPLDTDSKKRILALMKEASSLMTLEQIIQKQEVPTTHTYSSRNAVDKTITLGKVEGSIEAIRAALQKLEEGCSIEDAKAVCEPVLLNQMKRWRSKLKVYLSPFLHGSRYTSFGRHFTKVDKLKQIVDILHWYVQDGDMIVDFCCGANDFSCLMKKKLDERGKQCSYKNYDILQAKNDFNFEMRDWMSVKPKELPPGSQLIMGLNPPFGVNASLANQFIDKALAFKPKLVVLIVPPETQRLDKKKHSYDLILEDNELLAGMSFYLPGSVDINDKQMDQWNNEPPLLYLWSRPDWTSKHKAISQQYGHSSRIRNGPRLEENDDARMVDDFPVEDHDLNREIATLIDFPPVQDEPKKIQETGASVNVSQKQGLPCNSDDREGHENHGLEKNQSAGETSRKRLEARKNPKKRKEAHENHGLEKNQSGENTKKGREPHENLGLDKNQSGETPKKRREPHENLDLEKNQSGENSKKRQRGNNKEKHERGSGKIVPEDKHSAKSSPVSEKYKGVTRHSPPKVTREKSLYPPEFFDHRGTGSHSRSRTGYGGTQTDDKDVPRHSPAKGTHGRSSGGCSPENFDHSLAGSHSHLGTGYGGTRSDDVSRRYSFNTDEPYTGLTQRWPASPIPDYNLRNSEEQFLGSRRENMDARAAYRPYISEMDDRYGRETDIQPQLQLYRRQEPEPLSQRTSYLVGQDPGFLSSYGHRPPPADSTYNTLNTSSTMQRYAPRLDELNHTRVTPLGSEPPALNRSGMYNPSATGPGYLGPGAGYRAELLGFAPGPYHPFPQQNNSSGWLNE